VSRLPAFTATLALSRLGVVLQADQWKPKRPWGEGNFCHIGSFIDYCSFGTVCTPQTAGYSTGVCCFPGRINCRGTCRDPCPGSSVLNTETCLCERGCQPCPAYGQIQDPDTCQCTCAVAGQIPCQGICIDPLTDQTFCGGCPGDTCNPFDQKCCNGVCTTLGRKQNCRDCGDQVPAGWDCCEYVPTPLGTKQHCRSCGEECLGGRECTALGCKCPPGRTECGVCCPPTHKGCCNLTCTNLDTNTSHCGWCGNKCPTGASCVSGQCKCPTGSRPCGGVCWPNAQLCCENTGCPANSTDCCPGCQDFGTRTHVGNPAWDKWYNSQQPGTKWGSCLLGTFASFACHPTLSTIRNQQGELLGCCPPGCTGIANGLCSGCP